MQGKLKKLPADSQPNLEAQREQNMCPDAAKSFTEVAFRKEPLSPESAPHKNERRKMFENITTVVHVLLPCSW
jgi:hypothetical protein